MPRYPAFSATEDDEIARDEWDDLRIRERREDGRWWDNMPPGYWDGLDDAFGAEGRVER